MRTTHRIGTLARLCSNVTFLSFFLYFRFGASAALTAMASAVRKQPLTDVLKSPSFGHVAVKKPIAPLSSAASGGSDEAEVKCLRRSASGCDGA